ncbi:MAG: hypothetical protein LW630_12580, partial [Saprospiraceae bacterium]|nr:hypothetical protein [Saprospiraceae bacterium]
MIRDGWMVLLLCVISMLACSVQSKIKDGITAYERKQYALAVNLLEQELAEKVSPQMKARKYWLLGDAWMRLLQYREALSAFRQAAENGYGPEALSAQARAHRALEEYNEAITLYRKLGEMPGKRLEADRDILICQQAIDSKNKKPAFQIEKVFENSSVSDYAPALFEDRFLVFTSERKEATGKNPYQWTGEKFTDLFIMSRSGSEVQKFDAFLNTEGNEGAAWFARNMERVYFTRCQSDEQSDSYCQIFYSDRENGIWTEPVLMPFTLPG